MIPKRPVSDFDKLPSQICETCDKLLETFYVFKMRCIEVNMKLVELLIKKDGSNDSGSEITTMEHIASNEQTKISSANSVRNDQTSIKLTGKSVIVQKHKTTKPQKTLDDSLKDSTGQHIGGTSCLTENAQQTTTAELPSESVCNDQPSNLTCLETIKIEADEVELFQTNPLALVSCSYADSLCLNELKPETPNMLDDEEIINSSKHNNEKHIESLNTRMFIKSEEVFLVESHSVNRESSDDNIGKSCTNCGLTIQYNKRAKSRFCTCLRQKKQINENNKTHFECDICKENFQSKFTLSKHLKYHSRMNKFKCNICDSKYSSGKTLQCHLRLKHKESTNLKCGFCRPKYTKQYKSLATLLTHMNKIHDMGASIASSTDEDDSDGLHASVGDGIPDFWCEICNQEIGGSKEALVAHVNSHKKSNLEPKVEKRSKTKEASLCSYCGKIFGTSTLLSQHVRLTHLCIKKYNCKLCDKRYKISSALRNHMEAIHEKKKFQCTLCGSLLSSSDGLNSHMRKHVNRNKAPTLKCPVCPKLFKQKKNVDRHMRTHTGETPFKCSHCPREFTLNWNMIQHERLHTGEKRYKCEKCGKAFTHNVSKKNHMKYHKDEADVVTGENHVVQ